jgi:hypothetical protein
MRQQHNQITTLVSTEAPRKPTITGDFSRLVNLTSFPKRTMKTWLLMQLNCCQRYHRYNRRTSINVDLQYSVRQWQQITTTTWQYKLSYYRMTMTIGTVRGGKNQMRSYCSSKTGCVLNSVGLYLWALKLVRNDQEMIWEHVIFDIFGYFWIWQFGTVILSVLDLLLNTIRGLLSLT